MSCIEYAVGLITFKRRDLERFQTSCFWHKKSATLFNAIQIILTVVLASISDMYWIISIENYTATQWYNINY